MRDNRIYKLAQQILLMGAKESLEFFNLLHNHRLLTRETVKKYVMEALYKGREVRKGTLAYESLRDSVEAEITNPQRLEREIEPEAAEYLWRILSTAASDTLLFPPGEQYDGFTHRAYREVRDLLGKYGRRYLGISGPFESLKPHSRRVRAMRWDELNSESEESRPATYEENPFLSNPFLDNPLLDNPFLEVPWDKEEEKIKSRDESERRNSIAFE